MDVVKADAVGSTGALPRPTPPRPPAFAAPTGRAAGPTVPPIVLAPLPAPVAAVATPVAVVPVDPTAVLDELVTSVEGVRAAFLASVDGFGVARSNSTPDDSSHPAVIAAAVGLAHQLAAMGDGTELRQFVVEHDGGLLVVWPIGTTRVVAVMTASTVDQCLVRSFVQSWADVLSGATS